MFWHRYAVVEKNITASTYEVRSWHFTRTMALVARRDIREHFEVSDNLAILAAYEWDVLPARAGAWLELHYPANTRQPGLRYAR